LEIIDCHTHICPDNLAERNREIVQKSSGIAPAYDGSVGHLLSMMRKNNISRAVVNNVVLKPELMSRANDFTAQVVSEHGNLIGMAWIVPGQLESTQEVERCREMGFKGVKIHNSHFKVMPSDSRNDKIYEKIVEHDLPVLFHCGLNPYAASGATQYAAPRAFPSMIRSYPKMKVILGHLAGYQDDPEGAVEAVNASDNVFADLALDPGKRLDLRRVIHEIDLGKLMFGSDYPIREASDILRKIRFLEESDFMRVCSLNPSAMFSLP
jgi:predicted TIM-barrel fold metal-dependent hydrolase